MWLSNLTKNALEQKGKDLLCVFSVHWLKPRFFSVLMQVFVFFHDETRSKTTNILSHLFSFPLGMTERRSVLFLSLQTYVFLLVIPADAVLFCRETDTIRYKYGRLNIRTPWQWNVFFSYELTLGPVVAPFLRSGMSALLGLLALPSRGLAGGAPRLPGVVGLRSWTPPSSLALFSAVVVWLLFGWDIPGGTFWPTTMKKNNRHRSVTGESKMLFAPLAKRRFKQSVFIQNETTYIWRISDTDLIKSAWRYL